MPLLRLRSPMLILAMVVTTLVETLHRLFGLREKGLAILLGRKSTTGSFSRAAAASSELGTIGARSSR